jgi:predicted small secreted protein
MAGQSGGLDVFTKGQFTPFHNERVDIEPQKRRRYEPWNNINNPIDTRADWSAADVGIQWWLGLWPRWNRGASAGDRDHPGIAGPAISAPGCRRRKGKMNKMKRMLLCLLLAVAGQIVFTGCNTAQGFGQDVQNTGQAIQQKATPQ